MQPSELFARILEISRLNDSVKPENVNKMMHETLVLACHEGLKDSGQAFGNLFSQVDFLCKLHNVALADRIAVHAMRRHSNHSNALTREELLYDLRALSRFVSAVFHVDEPGFLLNVLPADRKTFDRRDGLDVRYVRCIVRNWDDDYLYVTVESGLEGQSLAVDCTAEHLSYIRDIVWESMQMNLLDCKLTDINIRKTEGNDTVDKVIHPGIIVVEPDYLIDISTIAACFKEYGHHPLTYFVDQMKPKANSQAILVGNLAGSALDDIINRGDDHSIVETIKGSFREKALEYVSCTDFAAVKFKEEANRQSVNLQQVVKRLFADNAGDSNTQSTTASGNMYSRDKAILEPSFVCEQLGLQGRVDLMTTDFRLLVEQKSGRNMNIERNTQNMHGSMQLEQHYVQLLLYYGVLRYNFNVGQNKTDIRLLYSKYEPERGLMSVAFYQKLFREAIKLRNEIVAMNFKIARNGFESIMDDLNPVNLNVNGLSSFFYERYLLPQIEMITSPIHDIPDIVKEYFCRMMTFVYREQLVSKVGVQEGVTSCAADLWNMPLAEKIETGNIYTRLTVTAKAISGTGNGYDLITLDVPGQGEDFLPNFRRGDMVYLYSYKEGEEPDARKSILYRGNITEIHSSEITVTLNDGQQNPYILNINNGKENTLYAIEHAGSDASSSSSVRGLHEFITSPAIRRDLLLGLRAPERDENATLTKSYNKNYDEILLQAKQSKDYFLLVGPPGTGKTSMALRFLVEEELNDPNTPDASILLMAYTNRAVDEICAMLEDAGLDYIRLGSEYSADKRYKPHLLDEVVNEYPKLSDIKKLIASSRIITGTTSMLMSRPFVFDIKHFTLAIIDEASQILEPNIIGLLASHRKNQYNEDVCCIDKFILVGDHKQLPAVVQQGEKESAVHSEALNSIHIYDCRDSLFERLIRTERANGRESFIGVLHKQGRMHPDIADFPCSMFYRRERLEPVPLPHQTECELPYPLHIGDKDNLDEILRKHRMIFIPSRTCKRPDLSDKVNTDEARIIALIVKHVKALAGDSFDAAKSIGIIVPYRNQIALIRKKIELLCEKDGLEDISIDTVERYQGSQRDVIIYSFTVQNNYQLDFLAANCFTEEGLTIDRKLNVAITRARRQMIITGNPDVLKNNSVFSKLIDYIKKKGGFVSDI
ncbi:MAG: AAA domain-containing protein [Prevotellaceae bacterium]|nr:AAA domain-containing protein [Prevotellaceae bacterium]